METKYGFKIDAAVIESSKQRLINQIGKLIPMKENEEDGNKQLNLLIVEISGLYEIFNKQLNFLTLLSKLEGLKTIDSFEIYRRTVFESISLLGDLYYE